MVSDHNPRFSTTRRLVRQAPADLVESGPAGPATCEGGLRTKGLYKSSQLGRPLITVITPVFNAAQYLKSSIKSVLDQPYDNVEYILIDGGSTDGSLDIIRENDDYIDYWISEGDGGIYDAMNKAVDLSTGDWIYFLGADDILVNCLHLVAPHLKDRFSIYYGDVYLPTKNKVYDGEFKFHNLISKNICHQAIFYARSVFHTYRYNLKYKILADYDLNIRCWGSGRFKFKYLPLLISIHNNNGCSFREVDAEFNRDKPELVRQNFSRPLMLREIYLKLRSLASLLLELIRLRRPSLRTIHPARRSI